MDSCLAASMNPHVLITMTSACSFSAVIEYPCSRRAPIMTSLSTRFFGQPRLTKPTLTPFLFIVVGEDLLARRPVVGTPDVVIEHLDPAVQQGTESQHSFPLRADQVLGGASWEQPQDLVDSGVAPYPELFG